MKTIYNYLQKGVGSNWRTTGFFSFLVLFMCFTLTGYAQTSTNLPGPYDVDNPDTSPVTVNVNDAANTTGFSELIYDSFQVTADWDETSGGAWSSEAGIEVVTSAGTVTVNPATSGSFDDGFSTTLIFEGDFAGSYDPATDGTLDLILNQSFGGSSADWSNITVTLFEPLPPLTNDDFADATAVVCSGNYIGSTVDATLDESDAPTNNADMDAPNVWFSYTGSGVAEFVTLDLCDSSYDTSLLVFTGTSGNLTLVEDNDDFCDLQSQLTFTSDGSTTYFIAVEGWNSSSVGNYDLDVTCELVPTCLEPNNLTASNITSSSTDLSWDAEATASFGYEWVVMNAGDAPAVDGSEVATGSVVSTMSMDSVSGLNSATAYDAYVRSICGIGDFSDWSSAESFTTLLDFCAGDNFIDSGGLSGNYSNNENITTTISPENSGDVVSVEFLSFNTESGFDYLFIYDGPDTFSPVISSGSSNDGWNGTGSFSAEGETFISTHPSGSLTFLFTSDNSATRSGWEADVTCGPPPSCLAPTNLTTSNITGNSVDLAWDAEATASFGYQWVVMNAGDAPAVDGSEVVTGTEASGDLMASVTGLNSATAYDAYVRSICGIGDFSDWSSAESFTTIIANDDCAGALPATVTPNGDLSQPITFDTTNAQDANVIPSCEGFDSTESDLWYEFTTNSTEGIILALLSGDVNDIEGAIYDSCGGAELFCFADGASVDFNEDVLVTGLMANTTYYLQVYAESFAAGSFSLSLTDLPSCLPPENLSASNITATTANLSWDAQTTASFGYEWVIMNAGDAPAVDGSEVATGMEASGDLMASVTGLSSITDYDAYVRSLCGIGDFSDWSAVESFSTPLDYCGGDNFIDSGGLSGDYSNNESISTTISPENSGDVVYVEFLSFDTESGFDYLFIYDGPDTSSPVISSGSSNDGWNGTGSFSAEGETFISTHPSGSLTFVFTSDGSATRSGWEADVTCGPPPSCLAPTNLTTSNITINSVDLSWDAEASASSGYEWVIMNAGDAPAVDGSEVATGTEASGDLMASVTGLSSITAYDAYVRSICGIGDFSDWSDVANFITLPANDNFADAIAVVCDGNYTGSTVAATLDESDAPSNNADMDAPNVWYSFTGSGVAEFVTVELCDSDYDTSLLVFTGTSGNLTLVEDNDDSDLCGEDSLQSQVTFTSDGSTTYFIAVEGWNASSVGNYDLHVTCELAPSCLEPSNLSASNISATSADFSWDAEATASFGYEWVVMNAGDAPAVDGSEVATGMEAFGDLMASVTGLSSITDYDAYVRSICGIGDFSDWSAVESFSTPLDYCGGDNFIDSGGLSGDYSNNESISTTISPENSGDVVYVEFLSFDTESGFDYLFVYDGPDTSSPVISSGSSNDGWNGTGSFSAEGETFISTHPSGSLTFVFTSDGSATRSGWEADVTCGPPPSCLAPTNLTTSNITINSVDLSWDAEASASSGYEWVVMNAGDAPAVDGSEVATGTEASGDLMASVTGLSSITDYDAYVRSICGIGDFSDWSSAVSFTTLPDFCAGDNFVDSGGLSGNYSNNENITTTISPENSGDVVSVEFLSFNTELNYDGLLIYDGPDTSSPSIDSGYVPTQSFHDAPTGSWNGTGSFSAQGETFTSTHPSGSLTFVFTSDGSATRSGWEASVSCFTPPTLAFQEVFTDNRAALSSSVAFNDVDGDNDQDFIITGSTQRNQFGPSGGQISRLYKNNGTGNFGAPVSGTPFMGLSYSSLSFSDVNQDGIKDVVSAGEDYSTGINYVKYYSSDGTGSFTETTGTPFPPNMKRVDFKIADFDNDGVNDILLIGVASNGNPASPRLFENRGTEMNPDYFNRFSPSPLPRVSKGSIAVADVDGDSDLDIFISGKLRNGNKISRLYRNEGNFQFTEITGTGLDQVDSGDSAFADVDDDGDEDLLISGLDSADNNVLKLYLNDGTGVFTEAIAAINIPSMWLLEAFDFADVDGDTDQDVLLTGYNPANYQRITTMWENLLYSSRRPNTGDTSGFNIDMDDEENDLSFGAGFKLVPNPTGLGFTNIIMPDVSGEVEVIINDVLGRAVSSQSMTITNNRIELDTKDLSSGVYVISLRKGKSTFTTKLIVE